VGAAGRARRREWDRDPERAALSFLLGERECRSCPSERGRCAGIGAVTGSSMSIGVQCVRYDLAGSSWYRIRREELATTATDDALCRIAATTGERAPPAETTSPTAFTAIDIP
jgi:hypothetical protein